MHVTSDYYRSRVRLPEGQVGLAARWNRSIQNTGKCLDVQPLQPSSRTLLSLIRHYENCHSLKRKA